MILELALPICAIVFSLLLCIVYFSKQRVKLFENRMYAIMIVSTLLDSVLVTIEKALVIGKDLNNLSISTQRIVELLNKFDACILAYFYM